MLPSRYQTAALCLNTSALRRMEKPITPPTRELNPSVMRALLVRTFPSINFSTASTLQRIPLRMETLNRKSSPETRLAWFLFQPNPQGAGDTQEGESQLTSQLGNS